MSSIVIKAFKEKLAGFLVVIYEKAKAGGKLLGVFLLFHFTWRFIYKYTYRKKRIRGQTVLITGAAQGLGQQMAIDFAKEGCELILWDLQECTETAKKVQEATGKEVKFSICDISDEKMVTELAKKVESEGGVDILVNNAGIVSGKPLSETSPGMIRKIFEVNVFGCFWAIQGFLPGMLKRNKGHVVNIASASGYGAPAFMVPYAASKAAVQRLDHTLRYELIALKTNVRTTQVSPFYISTGMFKGAEGMLMWNHITPQYASRSIVDGVRENQIELILPGSLYYVTLLPHFLPLEICDWIAQKLGLVGSMKNFTGHKK